MPDPCSTASCPDGTVCQNGACVTDQCKKTPCMPGLLCIAGECVDDPCRYVKCPDPDNYQCIQGTGACVSRGLAMGPMGGKSKVRGAGCHFAPTEHADQAALLFTLAALALALGLRRRRA
jgi:MYXO-CTERM domain-containing protein